MPKTYDNIKLDFLYCSADTGFSFKPSHGWRSKKHVSKFHANCVTMFYVIEYSRMDS